VVSTAVNDLLTNRIPRNQKLVTTQIYINVAVSRAGMQNPRGGSGPRTFCMLKKYKKLLLNDGDFMKKYKCH